MEVLLLLGLVVCTVVVAALAALVLRRGEPRPPAAVPEGVPAGQVTAPSAADQVEQAVTALLERLRADRSADQTHTVETVLALAREQLGTQLDAGERQLDRRNEVIAHRLEGVSTELRRVNDVVVGLQRDRAEQHGQLLNGLQETVRQSQTVAATTQSLREALSSSRARGQWGERMADDILRLAGFAEGVNYVRQRALHGGTIPDFTFLLPGDWVLHMDVKFPMDNYLRHLNATGDAERRAMAGQFLKDVRERVRSLNGRGYVEAGATVDFVLLFIPNEATYGFVHEHDPGLADDALRQRVVLCSPFTLFAVLAVVRQAVDSFALQRSTDEILELLARFSTQWEKFTDAMDALGRRLDSTGRAFEELTGPRRRQLQRLVDRVDDLRRHDAGSVPMPLQEVADPAVIAPPAVTAGDLTSDTGVLPAGGSAQPLPLRRPAVTGDEGDVRALARRLTG